MAPGSGGGGGAGGWAAGSDRDPRVEKLERSMGPFAATAPRVDGAASSSSSSSTQKPFCGKNLSSESCTGDAADKPLLVEQITMGKIRKKLTWNIRKVEVSKRGTDQHPPA
uniref:Uncharacterized protein n=1 Tax=Oryza sativa subsp. indica TaxID=39946 RepID=A0A679B9U2_ORYSI|nr:hypothetical protein [Oryza sativa Indica Group]BBD82338.1 hypothetical protein [Oryza sativa Indica Group]